MRNIEAIFGVIERSLFCDSSLSYHRTLEAIERLAQEIQNTNTTDERVWSIGETSGVCLSTLITGAYWFFADYHDGQWSEEYKCLCALGQVFKPGRSSFCPEEEGEVYISLQRKGGFEEEVFEEEGEVFESNYLED
jgi:hypothetical protein